MKTILSILSVIIVCTSCDTYRYAYSPSAHNTPILINKGDSKIAGYYSTNSPSRVSGSRNYNDTTGYDYKSSKSHANGFDIQGAYAITKHFAVEANYYHRNERTYSNYTDFFDTSTIRAKRDLFEIGVGLFTAIGKRKHLLLQIFAGGGPGKMNLNEYGLDNNLASYSRFYNAHFLKFYLEPAITFRIKEIFAGSITTRLSAVQFNNIKTNYTPDEKGDFRLDGLDQSVIIFFEPAFVGSFGINSVPGLRGEFQLGVSASDAGFIRSRFFNFSIGLVLDIGKLIKGRQK